MYQVDSNAYWQAQLMNWGPKVLIAILILVATWIVARAVKWVIQKTVSRTPALQKHTPGNQHETIGHQIGTIAKLIIWLVGIMAALQFLGIGQILAPINALTLDIFNFLPRLIGAGLIFFIGLIVARIVRQLVETVISAANVEGLLVKTGVVDNASSTMTGAAATGRTVPSPQKASIARALGILVFALIIFPVAIAALQVLGIESISGPLTALLNQILAAIPRIITAALWILIAYVAGRFVKTLLEAVLGATRIDDALRSTGVVPASTSPSRVFANIAMVAIILLASIEAAKQLGGGTIAIFLAQVTELGGKVIFGTLIIVVGVFLARILANLVGSGTGEGSYAQTIVRYAIIALFTAIGLTFMGLADQIVMMAFGLILGAAAVATALSFGLGGREAAGRIADHWADQLTGPRVRPPAARSKPAATAKPENDQPPLV